MIRDYAPANAILQALDRHSCSRLGLVAVELAPGQVLYQPGTAEEYVYFPHTAVISLVSAMTDGATAEVAMVGREGVVGLSGMFGMSDSATRAVTQVRGTASCATTLALRQLREQHAAARQVLDEYTQARLVQVAQVAACNRLHGIERRLARWLLDLHDRVGDNQFRISHQSMADMLGVHRPTITIGLARLQEAGAITHRHRFISIVDRPRLEELSCECHAVLHRAFSRSVARQAAGGRRHEELPPGADAGALAAEAMRQIAGRLLMANLQEHEARERAEAANCAKDHFLAMVSHELRAPLQAILGWCSVLAQQPGKAADGVPVIARNARLQVRLVNDLLDSVRISAGTLHVELAMVRLAEIVEAAVESVRPMTDAKRIAVRFEAVPGLAALPGDALRLQQVMVNLLTNAVKFTDEGGQVEVSLIADDGFQAVSIRDSGRGISPEALPRVFDRFEQGECAGTHGLGLGLSIARALVELHGGTILVDSPGLGRGTSCTVRLPAADIATRSAARSVVESR